MDIKDLFDEFDDEPDCFDDNNDSIELTITKTKKDRQPESLTQLFKELIEEYNSKFSKKDAFQRFLGLGTDDSNNLKDIEDSISHSTYRVNIATDDYLYVADENNDFFVLVPDKNGSRFSVGCDYHLYIDIYKGHFFLQGDFTVEEYDHYLSLLEDLDILDQCEISRKAKEDPEGFPLWAKLGKVKRTDLQDNSYHKRIIRERTEEVLKRIPLERNDLYVFLSRTLTHYKRCGTSDEAEVEMALLAKIKIVVMLLSEQIAPAPLSLDLITSKYKTAKITECDNAKYREPNWTPNVLVVTKDYRRMLSELVQDGGFIEEISCVGIKDNDYLFGCPMGYAGATFGKVTACLTKNEFPSSILFSNVDLTGMTMRYTDPLYGIAGLLRDHSYTDYYMPDFPIDAGFVQFICHVDELEKCPPIILKEIDVIVEL